MRTPDRWDQARATIVIAVGTAICFAIVSLLGLANWAVDRGGFFASDWSHGRNLPLSLVTPLTATLLHANELHLALNLLMLVICGRAVEGALGPVNLVILYLLGAYAAAAGQFAIDPASQMPMIGASGAISAVIGAYAMLFGKNKVKVANSTLALWLNSLWLLAAWIALQVVTGLALGQGGLMVAVGAHIGGFVIGLILARPLLLYKYRNA